MKAYKFTVSLGRIAWLAGKADAADETRPTESKRLRDLGNDPERVLYFRARRRFDSETYVTKMLHRFGLTA